MIWIATFCLLAVAAWLIFNGLNERRWVQAHSHDETVAADEGFLPSFSTTVDKRRIAPDGTVSYVAEPSALGRAVTAVQTQGARVGEKVQQARTDFSERQASGDGDLVGRTVSKVKEATASLGSQIEPKAQQARAKVGDFKERVSDKLAARKDGSVDDNRKGS